jgi:hypothetical protein
LDGVACALKLVPTLHVLIDLEESVDLCIPGDRLALKFVGVVHFSIAYEGPHIDFNGASDLLPTD